MLRNIVSNELFIVLLAISLLIVAMAKLTAPKRFYDFILVLGNNKYLKIYSRDQKFFDRFDALLFGNLIIAISVFCFIIYRIVHETDKIPINDMFKVAIGIGIFILVKVLVERLIGSLFEIDKLTDQYLFQKITFKNYLGVLLLPINALLLFTLEPTLRAVYCIIILLLIINVIGLISSFKTHQNVIKHNLFYFILYLCALEIAPYIILYKVLVTK
ncbi:DUF4271 domain-containing protein [Tamlana sp. 2201CG12-4]|uniref:DUF4271 domain-containing protein n=1 Tax=Tamlana sp. 2201CG12-4 TaxID=3112582 RepID=UPI002DB981C2|nr:DUF4271 domain-containing protein [Tamlana sp. 2201CG12-4]MEC3906620.1 DUF4271 domain-containing protein [Tamlana sp. 2201CG12-4]